MQTVEEYKEYTAQLEGEVKIWHDAYDCTKILLRNLYVENEKLKAIIKAKA